ncbi:PAS domain S-box protein [Alcaligenaceae bacterium]|nr:PAS domain S-box protein [Alcaligenaceae bacterium]
MTEEGAVKKNDYTDLTLDAIFAVDAQARCISASGACERIFGYKPEEMIGRRMLEFVHPEDQQRTEQSINRVMDGYLQRHFENRYIRKDGQVVYISWSATWSEHHQLRIGVARDITELKFDKGELAARELLSKDSSYWQLSASPRRLISPNSIIVPLSQQDHTVLLTLMSGGECVTRKTIIEALGKDFLDYDQRRLDTQMLRLRRKVNETCGQPLPVNTLRSIGYCFYEPAQILR